MLITIDTNNITDADRQLLATLLGISFADRSTDANNAVPAAANTAPESKPTRVRRTKLEIAFDEAQARYDGPHIGDGREMRALAEAYEALKAKDPENERLVNFGLLNVRLPATELEPDAEEIPADSGAAFSPEDTADTDGTPEALTSADITREGLTELASELISTDRSAMKALLDAIGVKRVSEVPEDMYGSLAEAIREKLKG